MLLTIVYFVVAHGITPPSTRARRAALRLAQAREDRAASDAAYSALTRASIEGFASFRAIITAFRDDNPAFLSFEPSSVDAGQMDAGQALGRLIILNEHGMAAPRELITRLHTAPRQIDAFPRFGAIAEALAENDNAALAAAIDDAERHNLVVHAARLRIVLAQRTGDCSQLDRARPLFERLRDRVSLRRLEEVAASVR